MIPRFIKKTPKAKRIRPIMVNKSVIEEKEQVTVKVGYIVPTSIESIETTFTIGEALPIETTISETEVSKEEETSKKPVKKSNKKKTTKQENTNPDEIITEETKTE